jgi:hypothetical protein
VKRERLAGVSWYPGGGFIAGAWCSVYLLVAPQPAGELLAVSCVTGTDCTAVGYYRSNELPAEQGS